jgi:hypothetical protein
MKYFAICLSMPIKITFESAELAEDEASEDEASEEEHLLLL